MSPEIPSTPVPGSGQSVAAMLAAGQQSQPNTPPASPTPPAPPATPPVTPPAAQPVLAPWKEGEVWKLGDKPWFEAVPEPAVRDLMIAKQYKTPAELAVAYSNLNKKLNGNDDVIVFPATGATPEQQAEFDKTLRTKLGVPDSPDKYDLQLGDQANPDFVAFGRKAFHEIGLPPAKAQQFVASWNNFAAEQQAKRVAAETAANSAEIAALEGRWGVNINANLAAGRTAMAALQLPATLVERVEGQIGTAAVVELLATIGQRMGESGWQGTGSGGGDPNNPETMTREQAQSTISKLMGDAEFDKKYRNKDHPEHASVVQYMERLHGRVARAT